MKLWQTASHQLIATVIIRDVLYDLIFYGILVVTIFSLLFTPSVTLINLAVALWSNFMLHKSRSPRTYKEQTVCITLHYMSNDVGDMGIKRYGSRHEPYFCNMYMQFIYWTTLWSDIKSNVRPLSSLQSTWTHCCGEGALHCSIVIYISYACLHSIWFIVFTKRPTSSFGIPHLSLHQPGISDV